MRFIPPAMGADVNRGEQAVFEALAHPDGNSHGAPGAAGIDTSGWTVLHSLDVADHQRRMAGEVDFLVVAPGLGVLVLEVKGILHVARRQGVWVYGDGPSARTDHRGPFKQASEALHSVRDRLVRGRLHLAGVPFWSAVCFPFLDFSEDSEEWHSWQVIDRRALRGRPLADLLAGVLVNGRRRMQARRVAGFDPDAGEPTSPQCEEIVRALRPDFEFFESPRSRGQRIEEEVRRYTEEQFSALDSMARNPRVIFDGPAGTGKTLLAIEAARRSVAAGRRVLLLCFNIPLRLWLADQTAELRPMGLLDPLSSGVGGACALQSTHGGLLSACDGSGPGLIVRTLHEQMLYLAQVTPEDSDTDSRFWLERLPELACECLLKEQESSGESRIYDEIIIDEAQDLLRRSYLDFLDLSLRGGLQDGRWRVFGDFEFQRIYPQHGQLTLDEIDPDGRYPVHGLRVNCRNTLSVAQLACACVGVDPTYCRVLRKSDDVPPQIHAFREPAAQQDLLAGCLDSLHDEGFAWADMAVLSTVADERSAVALLPAERWSQRLERVAQYSAEFDTESVRAAVENPTGHARCATIHRFKGLEARVVVITDVTRLDETVRALLYVGATRAVERLVVLAHKDVAAELRRLSAAWG